jgi:hypothetical protein
MSELRLKAIAGTGTTLAVVTGHARLRRRALREGRYA